MSEQMTGPKGGNLGVIPSLPNHNPEWRKSPLNVDLLPGGGTTLHRFEKEYDTATVPTKNEQVWHRMAAYMLNAGRTNSEIAIAAGVHPTTISHLRAQKWFQELCATIANTEGGEIVGLLRSEVASSIEKLVSLRDYSDSDRVQLSAAQILLEQAHGKPIQKNVSIVGHSHLSPEDEMAELKTELENLRQSSPVPALPDAERKT